MVVLKGKPFFFITLSMKITIIDANLLKFWETIYIQVRYKYNDMTTVFFTYCLKNKIKNCHSFGFFLGKVFIRAHFSKMDPKKTTF